MLTPALFAAQARVTLRNGQIQVVDVVSADQNGIMWKGGRVVAPTLLKNDQIAYIDFQEPRGWREGLQSFHKQEYEEAITYFTELANNRRNLYYPAPGNYASQAMLHLVNCYIETGKYAEISKVAPSITVSSLPIEYRYRAPIIAAWSEFGKGDYKRAAMLVDSIKAKGTSAGKAELAFIKGFALEREGKKKEAIQTYGGACSLDFGADTAISRKALENSIRLLESLADENRIPELQALVHTYAHSFGDGKLYGGASSLARELLAEELDFEGIGLQKKRDSGKFAGVKIDKEEKPKEKPKTQPSPAPSIITLDFVERVVRQAGKETPLIAGGIHSLAEIKAGKKGNFTKVRITPEVELAISGIGTTPSLNRRRLVLEPNKGLGVMRLEETDHTGEGIRMWVVGFDGAGARLVSVTFGSGDADFAFGSGDQAALDVLGLKPGQPEYETNFSAEGKDEDFKKIELNGGFISSGLYANERGGRFAVTQAKGRFFISSVSIELEPTTSATK